MRDPRLEFPEYVETKAGKVRLPLEAPFYGFSCTSCLSDVGGGFLQDGSTLEDEKAWWEAEHTGCPFCSAGVDAMSWRIVAAGPLGHG